MAKKAAAASRKKFLAKVREHLQDVKTKLLSEIDSELRAEREGNKDEGMDTYDLASEERDREINFILSDRERIKIKQIDDALERLDDGSYGVCESCGLDIAEERLDAMPFTRLCRDCQQDQEREAKSQRRYDDERNRASGATMTSATPIASSARPTRTRRTLEAAAEARRRRSFWAGACHAGARAYARGGSRCT